MRGNREGTELADDMESLLGPFVNVGHVLIKCQFILYSESEVFEVATCSTVWLWMEVGTSPEGGVREVQMTISFVLTTFSSRKLLVHHLVK